MTDVAGDDGASREPGLSSAVLRAFLGALAIVLLPALVFWAIGAGDDDDAGVIADAPAPEPDGSTNDGDEDVVTDADPAPEPDEPGDAGADQDEPEPENGEDDGSDDGDGEPGEPAPAPEPPAFPPGEVSVQVLDGHAGGDGSGARAVAAQLREAGYRIIAENPAIPYDVTTVLWTPGYEDQARQVAAELSAPEVREQPGTLSDQVMVHVVVGADRG